MPLPKQRHNKARQGRRRAGQKVNKALKPQAMIKCEECGKLTVPHKACANCGSYKGKKVVATK